MSRALVLVPLEWVEGPDDVRHVVKRYGIFLVWQLLPPSSDHYKGTHEAPNEGQQQQGQHYTRDLSSIQLFVLIVL